MPTLSDVAKRAGVSQSTVSRIVSGDISFSTKDETRELVWQAVNELGYVPSRKAGRNLQKHAENSAISIGSILNITIEKLTDPSFLMVLHGLERRLPKYGASLSFFKVANEIGSVLRTMPSVHLDGFITMHNISTEDLNILRTHAANIVSIGGSNPDYDSVEYDYYEIGTMAAEYLLSLGHRRFGYVYGSETEQIDTNQERALVAFQYHVHKAGGELSEDLIKSVRNWKHSACYHATIELMKRSPRPTAVFVASDLMAMTAISAITHMGLRIPQDVSLMGIANNEFTEYSNPPLTTIEVPFADIGSVAADMLIERIQGLDAPPRRVLLPLKLKVRASCAGV